METTSVSKSMDKAISLRSLIDSPYNTGDYLSQYTLIVPYARRTLSVGIDRDF